MGIKTLCVILMVSHYATAHICLLSPRQRGALDISVGGSPTCFRHGPPCGGQAPEPPRITYTSGETAFITWQQNYNHYTPGYPGYMDIAIAPSPDSTNFTTLALVTDRYVHAQDHQQNYTAVIRVPNMQCEHCVIRARYNSHKPGEQIFYQCADVKLYHIYDALDKTLKYEPQIPFGKKHLPLHRMKALRKVTSQIHGHRFSDVNTMLYGFAFNPFEQDRSHYVSIDPMTGVTNVLNSYDMGIDSSTYRNMSQFRRKNLSDDEKVGHFFVDEIMSVDYGRNTSNFLVHKSSSREDAPASMMILGTMNGSMVQNADIFQFEGGAINGLSWYTYGVSVAFRLQPAEKEGMYNLELGQLNFGGSYTKVAQAPNPEGLYVNYMWIDTDVNNYTLSYVLLGNENAADALNSRIYIFDAFNGKFIQKTEVDVTKYTFMSMHSFPDSYELYAFSPGLMSDEMVQWSVVSINPYLGNVTKVCDIGPPGVFERYYGGSVNQGQSNAHELLYHVLRISGSDADVVVAIDPRSCEMNFSDETNLRHIHTLSRGV